MPNFDFNNIDLSSRADIRKIQENFEEIEEKAVTNSSLETSLTNYISKSNDTFITKSNNNTYTNYEFVAFRSGNLVAMRLFYQIKRRTITQEEVTTGRYIFGGVGDWFIPNLNYLKVMENIPQIKFASATDPTSNITTYIEVTPFKDWDDPDPEPEEPNMGRYEVNISLNGASSVTLTDGITVELFAHYIVK